MRTKLLCTLFILLLLGCKTVFAQGNLQVNLLNDKCDSILIQTITFFPFGSGSTCPPLVYTLDTGSDTASVSLYYNATGA